MAVVVCPSCKRELQCDSPSRGMKCYHCLGLVDPRDRRQGLVRGTTLSYNRYTIEEQIGRGGFAITYRVTTQVGAQRVNRVIKEYFPNGFAENQRVPGTNTLAVRPEKAYQFATYSDAFMLEATHMDGLHDIRGVVRFYEFFHENETVYIVMQYVDGQSLSQYLGMQPQHCLQLNEAVEITRSVLRIMANVYRVPPMHPDYVNQTYHLLHRDLSLGNIMRQNDGEITIIDFGSSRFMYEQLDKSNKSHYTPVEQIDNTREQGQYTDIYAIGKMFYFMLCGGWPNQVTNSDWINNKARYDLPSVRSLRPDLPPIVDDIIKKATQYDYHNRYQTADEFLKALSQISKGGKSGKGGKSALPAVLIGAGAVGLLVAALAIVNSGKQPDDNESALPPADNTPLVPADVTEEIIRKYAYMYAEKGALLCTGEELATAMAALLERGVVYIEHEGDVWSSVVLNWNGEKRSCYVETKWLRELTADAAADYEAQARVSGLPVADNHYLMPVNAVAMPTATPTPEPTPTPTPAPVYVYVRYENEKGEYLGEAMLEVQRGEDLVIEAGTITEQYEVPQTTTYALEWSESGVPGAVTVQCMPTASPAPVEIVIRYVNENGEVLAEEKQVVTHDRNYFLPQSEINGYMVLTDQVDSSVHWHNGKADRTVFEYTCVPTVTPGVTSTTASMKTPAPEKPVPELVSLGTEQVTLIYGQSITLNPEYKLVDGQLPQLSFASNKNCVLAEQKNGMITLTAIKYGTDTLTVSDGRNTYEINVTVKLAVEKLSTDSVMLNSTEDVQYIDMVLAEGAEVNDFRIVQPLDGVNVELDGAKISISADKFVSGRLAITAGGRSFNIAVSMKDAIERVELYRAPMNALSDRSTWQQVEVTDEEQMQLIYSAASVQGEVLLINPETLSRTLQHIQCSDQVVYNEEAGMYLVDLSAGAWLSDGAAPATLTAGDTRFAVSVYTGDAVSNLNWIKQMLSEPYAVGSVNEIMLKLHPGITVTDWQIVNEHVADVSLTEGQLSINGAASGDTQIWMMLSNGEEITLPLSVRQHIGQLKTEQTSTCVGEEITVQLAPAGTAVAGEFTYSLDNDVFTVVRDTADAIVLRADKVGRAVLTVTDTFQSSQRIELRANTTVVGLSSEHVMLQDGGSDEVQIMLLEGKELPANVQIIHDVQGLEITRKDTVLTLRAAEGVNVSGTVVIDVDGEQFQLTVSTADRLQRVTVYVAANADLANRARWTPYGTLNVGESASYLFAQNAAGVSTLIFEAETLSGSHDALTASECLQYDAVNGVYFVGLDQAAFAQGGDVVIGMDGESITAQVYTGALVLNMDEMQSVLSNTLAAGAVHTVRPSLYGGVTLEGCYSNDENVAKAAYADGLLSVTGQDSGTAMIGFNLLPLNWTEQLSVEVRQQITGLTASGTEAYLGEQITVKVDSLGKPLAQEYTAALTGDAFTIVKHAHDEIVLMASGVGEAKLTVTDAFGTQKELTFTAQSAASGLTAARIELKDGETKSVQLVLAEGEAVPENISISNPDDKLEIRREQAEIFLTVKEGAYVNTTVEVVVDGAVYPLQVVTADRLEQVSVWYAKNSDLQDRSKWTKLEDMAPNGSRQFFFSAQDAADSCLIFAPESISGTMEKMQAASGMIKDESLGIYYARLNADSYKTQSAAPLTITLGDLQIIANVYTGDLVTNIGEVRTALAGTLEAGQAAEAALTIYEGASVERCEVLNAKIAAADCRDGMLQVTGIDSGETVIRLTMAPTGETVDIPVAVRQAVQRLETSASSAFVGEDITVNVVSKGVPAADEFTYSLDNDVFSKVKTENGAVILRAEHAGTGILTVKDSLGNSKIITLVARSTVSGLSADAVTLKDGETKEVTFKLASGKTATEKPTVLTAVDGLGVVCDYDKIILRTNAGDYVQGTLVIELEGETYQLQVSTQDRITDAWVEYPASTASGYNDLVKRGTLYLHAETLSGDLDGVSVSGPWQIAEHANGVLILETTADVAELAKRQTLKVLVDGNVETDFAIDYPNALLSVPGTMEAHKINEPIRLTVGQDGFDTLFGTLEGIACQAEGLTVQQENETTLTLMRDSAGTGTLTLTEKDGRTFNVQATFDAYVQSVIVNGVTVSTGSSTTLTLTEEESVEVTLNIVGGDYSQLSGFSGKVADGGCVQISGSGANLKLTATGSGSTGVTLADRYGSVVLYVDVAALWRFPNADATEDEIRNVSAALKKLGHLTGRTNATWDQDDQNAVLSWKQAHGYAGGPTLLLSEYEQLLEEYEVAMAGSATPTPVPLYMPRTNETTTLTDIAVSRNEIYLLDKAGWVVVMSKDGSVLAAFPAQDSKAYTMLFDTGDVPVAADSSQLYVLNSSSLKNIVSMIEHPYNKQYLHNMLHGLQNEKVSQLAAMSQNGIIIVLPETTKFMSGSNLIDMSANQAVYALNGNELAPLSYSGGRLSQITAVALDESTFAVAAKSYLYLSGKANEATRALGMSISEKATYVQVMVDGAELAQSIKQIALSNRNVVLRTDSAVLAGGADVPGQLGEPVKQKDNFVTVYTGGTKDIALSDTTLYILTNDGKLLACGKGSPAQCKQLLSGIAAISADDTYGYAITTDGKVYRIDGCSTNQITDRVVLP